jgi:hypothetical protein
VGDAGAAIAASWAEGAGHAGHAAGFDCQTKECDCIHLAGELDLLGLLDATLLGDLRDQLVDALGPAAAGVLPHVVPGVLQDRDVLSLGA